MQQTQQHNYSHSPHGIFRVPVHLVSRLDIINFIEQRHPRQRDIGSVFIQRVRVGF